MKRTIFTVLAAVLAVAALSRLAVADGSNYDPARFALGAGASYEWYNGDNAPAHRSELAGNVFGAWVLTEHFSAAARATYGAANEQFRFSPGIHYRASLGSEAFAAALTYDFYGGKAVPPFANEWVASVIYSRPLGEYLTLSAAEGIGFDNHVARTSVQVTVPVWPGRDK